MKKTPNFCLQEQAYQTPVTEICPVFGSAPVAYSGGLQNMENRDAVNRDDFNLGLTKQSNYYEY